MIKPNMVTMFGFLATDADVAPPVLDPPAEGSGRPELQQHHCGWRYLHQRQLHPHRHRPGRQRETIADTASADYAAFRQAVLEVSILLAQAIVRDGEGATKFITVRIDGGRTKEECRLAAYAIAHSPLVKTAFFASDPNLGRILAAVGYAGIADLDQTQIDLYLDDVHVVHQGGRRAEYREEDGARVMKQAEITVRVDLNRGPAHATVWTCDLSYDYVKINADYRS